MTKTETLKKIKNKIIRELNKIEKHKTYGNLFRIELLLNQYKAIAVQPENVKFKTGGIVQMEAGKKMFDLLLIDEIGQIPKIQSVIIDGKNIPINKIKIKKIEESIYCDESAIKSLEAWVKINVPISNIKKKDVPLSEINKIIEESKR